MGLAFHGLAGSEGGGDELLDGLLQFLGGDEVGFYLFDFGEQGGAGGLKLFAIHHGADAEEAGQAGAVGPGIHVMDEAGFFAHLLEKAGAAAAAEQHGEDIQDGDIGMAQFRDVPGKMDMAEFHGRFLDDFARGHLARFHGQHHGRHGAGLGLGVGGLYLRDHVVVFHIAHDDVEDVVGRVFFGVIIADVRRLHLVENIRVADDGVAVGALGVGGLEETTAGAAAGVVEAHVHFAADHVHLLGQLIGRQGGVLHDVAEDINGLGAAGVGDVNVIDGAVEAGIGVHVAAGFLDFLVNAAAGAGGGAFEEHVLEHVGEAGAEPVALMNAAGPAPGLDGDDGRAVIFAHDDGQPVIERGELHAGRYGGNFAHVSHCQ